MKDFILPKVDDVDTLPASAWNSIAEENKNAVETSGQTLSEANSLQLAEAVGRYVATGDFYSATNTANSYVLVSINNTKKAPSYLNGARFSFKVPATNTGASTANIDSIGVTDIRSSDGAPLIGGELVFNAYVEFRYNDSGGYLEIVSGGSFDPTSVTNLLVSVKKSAGDTLSIGRINRPQNTGVYGIPLAATIVDGEYIVLQVDDVISATATLTRSGGDVITTAQGDVNTVDFSGKYAVLTSNGVDKWIIFIIKPDDWQPPSTVDFTMVAGQGYQVDASANTIDAALPVISIGDSFTLHNLITSTFKVQILNPIETIKGNLGDIAAAENLEILPGESVQIVAKTALILSVVGAIVL